MSLALIILLRYKNRSSFSSYKFAIVINSLGYSYKHTGLQNAINLFVPTFRCIFGLKDKVAPPVIKIQVFKFFYAKQE